VKSTYEIYAFMSTQKSVVRPLLFGAGFLLFSFPYIRKSRHLVVQTFT
jgi:membrane protein CcdC involved in cytochrome C biogenesis